MDLTFVPKFSIASIDKQINNALIQQAQDIENYLVEMGIKFVENARVNAEFMNHTFNLRSSIGYAVTRDRVIRKSDFKTIATGADGTEQGIKVANEAIKSLPKEGFALIGVAGEFYAGYVESRGFDVITGSGQMIENILRNTLGNA